MNPIVDYLVRQFKDLGHSDEESQSMAEEAATIPELSSYSPSSFDVNVSDNTATQKGMLPTATEIPIKLDSLQPNPDANPLKSLIPPSAPVEELPPVLPPEPIPAAKTPVPAASKETVPETPAPDLSALTSSAADEARRKEELEKAEKAKKMAILPSVLGGIGDAAMTGASALGVTGKTNTQEKILERAEKQYETSKGEIDTKIKNDPNSDISKAYRQMVLEIAPDLAKQPSFQNMSAQMIGDKLPLIDTMMKSRASADARKIALAQRTEAQAAARESKSLALSEREDQFNQRRWERFGAAVNPMNAGSRRALGIAANNNMRADRLLATAQNPKITSQDYSNLVADLQGIYKGGVPDQVMLKHGDYPSVQRKAGQILGMLSGNPAAVHTPELLKHLTILTQELKAIDNKVITDNLGFNKVIFDELEKADPDKFQRAMAAMENMTVGVTETNQPSPTAPPMTGVPPMGTSHRSPGGYSYTVR